jgi:chlorobactene glucosyltransferase
VIQVSVLVLSVLVVIALISVVNTLTFPRLGSGRKGRAGAVLPRISVLVPARDEAGVIGQTVRAILAQDYPGELELIVLDDDSSDGTAQRARQAALGDPRLQVIPGTSLPPGWAGKNWACWQLAKHASGDWLVFTDADVRWEPGALSSVISWFERSGADCLTVWPTQETRSWAERLVVPMMMFTIIAYLPELCVRYLPWPAFSASNGQFMAFRRAAYERIGGHEAVKSSLVEDVSLAREVKRYGLRLVMTLGNGLIHGRMYQNWPQARQGFAKNMLAGHGGNPLFLLFSAFFHWLLFLLPWFWFFGGILLKQPWTTLRIPLAMIALGVGARALSAAATRHLLRDALLMPISVVLMTVIAAQSLWWHYRYGGPLWKGRQIVTRVE